MQLSLLLPSNLRKGVFDDHLFHSQKHKNNSGEKLQL